MAGTGVFSPGRAKIEARTLRRDRWWLEPAITFTVFTAFIIYSTIRAFWDVNIYSAEDHLLSPFYSPCLTNDCPEGASHLGTPVGDWFPLSPALLILILPLGFRMTCYYYRKAYYRAFWLSPPACAVAEPHTKYTGETRFPLIFQNAHRWFFWLSLPLPILIGYDGIDAIYADGEWKFGLGALVLLVAAVTLLAYSLSCHSCRHIMGGRLNHFSKHPIRYWGWTQVTKLNGKHMQLAWISLIAVWFADFYVLMVAADVFGDPHIG
ncbi:hypothetical protein [Sporichthya sp.]|uniref:hypothetical protein n=1 Tax=Sporichthya sp. TaxID=65475 RepID=UPI0018039E29|nr:hypothetical protein [Sporichthya sp.]MBA3742143.1 hypothetical protein [Sporichthya sp.]